MTRRVVHHLDFKTGTVTTNETVVETGTLAERVGGMRAQIREQFTEEIEHEFASLVCDGCGAVAQIDVGAVELPAGWVVREGVGDLCPKCELTPTLGEN